MVKEYFTIGEISSLLGLSSHTLRYYDKIGLIRPAIVNEQNSYRMYSYDQLFTLEHIRNLQQLGFSLDQIKDIFSDSTTATIRGYLEEREKDLEKSIRDLSLIRDTVSCSLKYYRQLEDGIPPGIPFVSAEETRWLFAEPYEPGEPLMGTAGLRLTTEIRKKKYAELCFLRHIGFILDYAAFMEGKIVPTHYFMFLDKAPASSISKVKELPAGRYLCHRCRILAPGADVSSSVHMLKGAAHPGVVIAREFEKNLNNNSVSDFENSMFEIQVLL